MSTNYLSHHKISYQHNDSVLEELRKNMDKSLAQVARNEGCEVQ